MEQLPDPTLTFNEKCHFFQEESESPNPTPSQNFNPSTLTRIEDSKEKALTKLPSKLGVDFSKKTIKKGDISTKQVSEKEMSQLTKALHSLGLTGDFSNEDLSKALENSTLDQEEEGLLASHVSNSDEPSKIVTAAEKLFRRHNRILQQIQTINTVIKQKLMNNETVDPCLVFMAINLACLK